MAAAGLTTTGAPLQAGSVGSGASPVNAMFSGMRSQSSGQMGSGIPSNVPPEMRAPGQGGESEEDLRPPQKPSEPPKLFKLDMAEKGIATISLCRAPVNSFNLDFFQELNQWLLWLGSDESCRGVIFTSAIPTVFSAGLDISELYSPKEERLVQFWMALQENWMILNSFPKPIIAAINGNSPAGGCIVALACDYRVMARCPLGKPERPYRIGLNETKLGIVAPAWVMPAYAQVLGPRTAERMLQLGETPTADDALTIGLVDAVVEEDKVMETAIKELEKFMAVPNQSRWMSRDMMRREYLQLLASEEDREYDTQFVVQLITNPDVQKTLGSYLARLSGKKK